MTGVLKKAGAVGGLKDGNAYRENAYRENMKMAICKPRRDASNRSFPHSPQKKLANTLISNF